MNVCILKESLDIGGTERSAANISKVLEGEHKVWVALYDASKIKYSYSGELVDFNLPPKDSLLGKVINTYKRDTKLRKLIKTEHIDVLYTFTGIGNRQTRYKYDVVKIVSARDFGGMYEKYNEYKIALNNSSAMICNSEYTKQFYLSKYPEDRDKIFTLYNYIDVGEIRRQATENVEEAFLNFINVHGKTIVSVGRFCKEKGFECLLEAFAVAREKDNDLGLVLVGDGDYKKKYLKVIEKLHIRDNVYFTGFQKNPYKYMNRCNCFVLSSLSEGFPNVLVEAMSLGLPVIAANCYSGPSEILRRDSDYGAVTESFVECDYGIITPQITQGANKNALSQLALAINTLLGNSEKITHYAKMSEQRARDFSAEAARKQLNLIFDELVQRRQGV